MKIGSSRRRNELPDMKTFAAIFLLFLNCAPIPLTGMASSQENKLGLFEKNGDIGAVKLPGSVEYDEAKRDLHRRRQRREHVGREGRLPLRLEEGVGRPLAGGRHRLPRRRGKDPHRKACLMIRQSLDADSAYVDVALHGDGLTSLQFREAKGAATHEVQANVTAPRRLRHREARQVRRHVPRRRGRGADASRRAARADRVRRSRSTSASASARTTRT